MKAADKNLIEQAKKEISEDHATAIVNLCMLMANPKKFKDLLEYGYFLGGLFALVADSQLAKTRPELRYDEIGELTVDERIKVELAKFDVKEKTAIAAFLSCASKPLSLDKVEAFAGKL
jgi:hypothetical protein